MKLNKFFLGVLGGVAMMAASCSSDDEDCYLFKEVPVGFYFSNELPTQHEISPEENVYNGVVISRMTDNEEETVNLAVTKEDGSIYSIPSSITFAEGEKEVIVPITYDPEQIEYGKYEAVTINIKDKKTPYGVSAYTFKIGVTDWSEWQAWNEAGTACYYYSGVLFVGDDPDLPFSYRQNVLNPNLYQFKLEHWGYDVDLLWDYDAETGIVSCDPTFTGYVDSNYGDVYVSDIEYYDTVLSGGESEGVYGYFDEEQGILAVPIIYYVDAGYFGKDYEYIYIDGYSRADYSADVVYSGIFTNIADAPFAVGYLTLGADAQDVKAVVVNANENVSAVAAAIAAGELPATDVKAGRIEVPIDADLTGKLQIVVTVIVDGVVQSVASAKFEYYGGASSPWVSLGMGYYTDDFVLPLTGAAPYTYAVEIEEHSERPGLYRIVNAYAPIAELFEEDGGNVNLEIHAEEADGVYILQQSLGLDLGYGDVSIDSEAGYYVGYYGYEDFKEAYPEYFGTVKDGIITLPLLYNEYYDLNYQGSVYMGGELFNFGGMNGAFELVLPDAAESVKAKAKAKAQATKFAMTLKALNGKKVAKKHVASKKIVKKAHVVKTKF